MLNPASYHFNQCDLDRVNELRKELSCSETVAWLLARRGVSVEEATDLFAQEIDATVFHDPLLLGEMAAAVERLAFARDRQEIVAIHGDYDADGVCATTLLTEGLEEYGLQEIISFIPNRFANGYGLQIDSVERFAQAGARLLITVDCGITSVEAITHARDLGIDVIVCDHHQAAQDLPNAIIASTDPSDYPFPTICATVVVGKLLEALGLSLGASQYELEAIATIADCMPLIGENRQIVKRGLKAIKQTKRHGLIALINSCGLNPHEVDAEAVGFKLAPRINAVGRIDDAEKAFELLRADAQHAPALAAKLDEVNERRREITDATFKEAEQIISSWSQREKEARIYVIAGSGWNEGIVGIVASKLAERYWRPVIVISAGDPARGSGRSVSDINLHAAIASCNDLLLRCGGHEQAAGITIDPAEIPAFREQINVWANEHIRSEQLTPSDTIDALIPSSELRLDLVNELALLGPYGEAWPEPKLLVTNATVEDARAIGKNQSHLKFTASAGRKSVASIAFGMAHELVEIQNKQVDLCCRPQINRFRGAETLQLSIERIYPVTQHQSTWDFGSTDDLAANRRDIREIIENSATLLPAGIIDLNHEAPAPIETILLRERSVDLRHRDMGLEHVAQLLTTGGVTVCVTYDTARRVSLFDSIISGQRFGHETAVAIDERVSSAKNRSLLRKLNSDERAIIVVDYQSLDLVLAEIRFIAALVVYDPPMSTGHRDLLASAAEHISTHLVYSAREIRFAQESVKATLNVRATLGQAWKYLRDHGAQKGQPLAEILFGTEEFSNTPSALTHGLHHLFQKGLLQIDDNGALSALKPAAVSRAN